MPPQYLRALFSIFAVIAWSLSAARAQEVSGGGTDPVVKVRSYGDERPVNVEEELAALRSANAGLAGSVPRQPLTFAAALTRVRELARSAGGPAVLAPALKALPDNEPVTLRLLAVRELTRGRTTAMFLLLLAAYDRDPNSADALADLAGALAGLGYANEALALLDELARRNAVPSPPMDISGEDALAYLRGYCLVRLGDTAAAKPLLAGVAERQPMLAEAARLMAVISEDEAELRKFLLLGVWRHRSPLMVCAGVDLGEEEPDPLQSGEEVAIDLRSLLDLSKGERGRLPDIPYARSVTHANGLIPLLEAKDAALDDALTVVAERKRPRGFEHPESGVFEKRGHRMHALVMSLGLRDQKLRELERARRSVDKEWRREMDRVIAERDRGADEAMERAKKKWLAEKRSPSFAEIGEVFRPFHDAALARARGISARREKAVRDYFAEWHLLASAIPAQVGDKAWWEHIRLTIEHQRLHDYSVLLGISAAHARVGAHGLITTEPSETPPSPETQDIGKCDGDKSLSFSTNQLPGGDKMPFEFGVEMTCEGMSVEVGVDTRIPGISVSTELGIDTKGDFTAFVGPKATAKLETGIVDFTGAAKGGAYVTGNKDGIKDAGVKYEVKAGAGVGSYSGAQKIAEGKVSFMPAPATGDGGFEPLMINGGR